MLPLSLRKRSRRYLSLAAFFFSCGLVVSTAAAEETTEAPKTTAAPAQETTAAPSSAAASTSVPAQETTAVQATTAAPTSPPVRETTVAPTSAATLTSAPTPEKFALPTPADADNQVWGFGELGLSVIGMHVPTSPNTYVNVISPVGLRIGSAVLLPLGKGWHLGPLLDMRGSALTFVNQDKNGADYSIYLFSLGALTSVRLGGPHHLEFGASAMLTSSIDNTGWIGPSFTVGYSNHVVGLTSLDGKPRLFGHGTRLGLTAAPLFPFSTGESAYAFSFDISYAINGFL